MQRKAATILQVDNVLSLQECQAIVAAAESHGFQHQGSRGAAHGEVRNSGHLLTFVVYTVTMLHVTLPSLCQLARSLAHSYSSRSA